MAACNKKGKCTMCHKIKELNPDEEVDVCEECYNEHKCSVCLDLIQTKDKKYNLFDDYKCCKEVKLCKGCCDSIKSAKVIRCPVCKYTPDPPKEPEYNLSYYLKTTTECLKWINNATGKNVKDYYINENDKNINIKQFFELQIAKHKENLRYFLIRHETTQDILETQVFYYCGKCVTNHCQQYMINYNQGDILIDTDIIMDNTMEHTMDHTMDDIMDDSLDDDVDDELYITQTMNYITNYIDTNQITFSGAPIDINSILNLNFTTVPITPISSQSI